MTLQTREFDVDGINVIVGHDRETGKRYFCQEVKEDNVFDLPWYLTSTKVMLDKIKAIFWIK